MQQQQQFVLKKKKNTRPTYERQTPENSRVTSRFRVFGNWILEFGESMMICVHVFLFVCSKPNFSKGEKTLVPIRVYREGQTISVLPKSIKKGQRIFGGIEPPPRLNCGIQTAVSLFWMPLLP